MKEYPKIQGTAALMPFGHQCYAFYKYDGSNLRFEHSKKRGWYKFGTRRQLFDRTDPLYGPAIDIFYRKYAEGLEAVVYALHPKAEGMIAYAEYFGPNSFAGQHVQDEAKDLVLFDVNVHKKGFVLPHDFIRAFAGLDIARVVYQGEFTSDFQECVRTGQLRLDEGVIVKGGATQHGLWMRKIKTLSYLERLKALYGERWNEFWE